jgi:LacI family transcriptional regulator
LRAQGARGVLLAGSGSTDAAVSGRLAEAIAAFTREGGRVTAIGARPDADVDAVVPDNVDGARRARAHLEALGHRRIGAVSGPDTLLTVRQRLEGLGDGLTTIEADFTREGGYEAAKQLLAEHPDLTALIALNDVMAAGVLAAAKDTGRDVPGDLSVIGFDDLPFTADLSPALTTVRLPLRHMGERAMALLLADPDETSPQIVDIPVELVVRASTGRAASR